jgi:hypothetical protein
LRKILTWTTGTKSWNQKASLAMVTDHDEAQTRTQRKPFNPVLETQGELGSQGKILFFSKLLKEDATFFR